MSDISLTSQKIDELISTQVLDQIYFHARQSYPNECCGLIMKRGIRPCKNILDRLHQEDPVRYPRNARQGFVFSSQDSLFLSQNIASENPVTVIYHSHPNVGAYFSNEDQNNALYEGRPLYPVAHLVIDIQKDVIVCSKLFQFIDFSYQEIAVLPGMEI